MQAIIDLWQPLLGSALVIGLFVLNARDIAKLEKRVESLERLLVFKSSDLKRLTNRVEELEG